MKRKIVRLFGALVLMALLAMSTGKRASADETPNLEAGPIMCGGELGVWASEPFWSANGVWSITVWGNCDDGSIQSVVTDANEAPGDNGSFVFYVTE